MLATSSSANRDTEFLNNLYYFIGTRDHIIWSESESEHPDGGGRFQKPVSISDAIRALEFLQIFDCQQEVPAIWSPKLHEPLSTSEIDS